MKVLIVIPAYNEMGNIVRVVENIRINYPQYDYIVVNDGSKDDTAEMCRKKGYHLLDLPINLGLAGAFQTGMRYAYLKGYDAAIQVDGDGQHEPAYIESMCSEMLTENRDIVIGSRYIHEKKPRSMRMLGSNILSAALWLTTGKKIADPTSGMRIYSRRILKLFSNNMNYGPEPDTLAYLLRCGASISEVQVQMYERLEGQSYLRMGNAARYMLNMVVSILLVQFFRKRSAL